MEFLGQQTPTGLDGVSLASLLTGKGPAPARSFYWHFPHYTNQGSRPAGAMRQGPWKLIEPYDEGEPELYNLDTDVGEQQNLSAQQPARLATMRTSLADWRQQVNAQTNQPNPKFDSTKYQTLYRDLDASRFAPLEASSEDWKKIWNWRKEMDAVVPVK